MKKLLGIVVLGLLWCNVVFGDSLKTILKNSERVVNFNPETELNNMLSSSSLPKCKGQNGFGWDDVKKENIEWNNCIGISTFSYDDVWDGAPQWYVGEFKNASFNGNGILLIGGEGISLLYVGQFKNDELHGEVIRTIGSPAMGKKYLVGRKARGYDDSAIRGIWENGELISIWKNGKWIEIE